MWVAERDLNARISAVIVPTDAGLYQQKFHADETILEA